MSDKWKDIEPYGLSKPPYDGETYLIQTQSGLEIEARYDDPDTPETGTDDLTLNRGSWKRVDDADMPDGDPPVKWRPRPLLQSVRSMEP